MTSKDPRVAAGTEAHYIDAAYYDSAYKRRKEDVRFYADVAERFGGPVLELGVGTGRVAVEIAKRGIEVVGVDRVPEMLERAKQRLEKEPRKVKGRVTLKKGDLLRLRLQRRFPLVIAPFNVFMHLYERKDWERALKTVKVHLGRRGRLVFDVRLPDLVELSRDPQRTYRSRPVRRPEDGRRYRYGESFEYDPVTQIEMITMVFQPEGEPEGEPEGFFITPLAHRQIFPQELEALLHYNDFTLLERYGDFEGGALGPESESQIIVSRPRGR